MRAINSVGVVGLGNMGGGMANSLVRAGFEVIGYDLERTAVERAGVHGVTGVTSLAALATRAQAVVTVLPDSPQVEACYLGPNGLRDHLAPETVCIECSTIEPAVTDRVAAAMRAHGCSFLDAGMGRSPAQAETGELLFMVGATDSDLQLARPVLDAMGDEIHHCGLVGSGIRMKLVLNLLSQSTCQLSAEVVALGLKMGLDRDVLLAVMGGGLGANGFITRYWPTKVLVGDTSPGFAISLSAKDLRHAVAMANEVAAPVPTARAAADAINAAAQTHGDLDVSGLLVVACENTGSQL